MEDNGTLEIRFGIKAIGKALVGSLLIQIGTLGILEDSGIF